MSLSTLRRSLFLSKSPLRLYDSRHLAPNSVRLSSSSSSSSCSSCSSFRSSYLSSESHEYSLIYSDFENKKDQDGGSGPNGSFRSSHALLGLLFGSGIVISSLKSRVLAADGSSSSVAQNDSATFSDKGVEKEEDEEEVGGAYDAVTASSYDEAVVEASDYDEASNSVGGMDQSLVPVALASSDQMTLDENANSNEIASSEGEDSEPKKKRVGFRDRRIIEYENRIRAYSTPDKVFRYFASLQMKMDVDSNAEVFMTPEDFVRSLTPGVKQPEGLGLDQFLRIDPKKFVAKSSTLPEDSIFFKLARNGLLTFSDYLFLVTMLSTPPSHFEMAFKMFDFNGDGNVDPAEFEKVQNILRSRTTVGKRHRDHSNTGSVMKSIQPALTTFFFGSEKDQKLTVEKFIRFQKQLQEEILRIEFHRYDLNPDGTLKEVDFADCLLTHAGLSEKKVARMKRRVKRLYERKSNDDEENEDEKKLEKRGIGFEDFADFFCFLNKINDVEMALTFYHVAGAPIDKVTFAHVAKTVAGVRATDHVIDVIFILFDENQDEHLSHKEFISVMKQRGMRGLQKSRDTGFTNLVTAMWKCGKNQAYDKLGYGDSKFSGCRRHRR